MVESKKKPQKEEEVSKWVPPYMVGKDPEMDAWYTAFFIENHIDHFAYPKIVAAPEQVRFMVYMDEDERYYPCSEIMFNTIMDKRRSKFLKEKYSEVLKKMILLVEQQIDDEYEKKYLKTLITTKFNHETREGIMIPSRIEKRLLNIYLNRTQIEDPYLFEKNRRNLRASQILGSEAFREGLDSMDDHNLSNSKSLEAIKDWIDDVKLRRLLAVSVEHKLWESEEMSQVTKDEITDLFKRRFTGNGETHLWKFLKAHQDKGNSGFQPKKILWLADESGEIMFDLAIIRYLNKMGHKVIIAFKNGPLFTKVDFNAAQGDEQLRAAMEGVPFLLDRDMNKNELIQVLKTDKPLLAVSDGTRENINLLLVSTTFARLFKEVDGIISKGLDQRRRFFETHFDFTQDIYSIAMDENGSPSICFKPRHPEAIKFSAGDLEEKAQTIISQMTAAKAKDMTVMFYSGIIGSIPGKVAIAKKVMSLTVESIKQKATRTYIINPSEYFETGMDADDLMYMWEIVQRSGLIDIWRFQTYDDIEAAFLTMKKKIPPEWVGKDATFSTGCTKEMRIALDVQKKHPEMQIIGPSQNKFSRRQEYGVGKMYDRSLEDICML
ncbi:hypothetical protein ACFL1Z_02625 [Thermodesulfobacteriota bacterium]